MNIFKKIVYSLFVALAAICMSFIEASEVLETQVKLAKFLGEKNEDRYVIDTRKDGSFLLGVFDGVEGSEAAEYASQNIVSHFNNEEQKNQVQYSEIMVNIFAKLDEEIKEKSENSGTEASVCYVDKNGMAYVTNSGRSQVRVFRNKEVLMPSSHTKEEGETNVLAAKLLGAKNGKITHNCKLLTPETSTYQLKDGDFLVVGTHSFFVSNCNYCQNSIQHTQYLHIESIFNNLFLYSEDLDCKTSVHLYIENLNKDITCIIMEYRDKSRKSFSGLVKYIFPIIKYKYFKFTVATIAALTGLSWYFWLKK